MKIDITEIPIASALAKQLAKIFNAAFNADQAAVREARKAREEDPK